jgi:hypothetical protein
MLETPLHQAANLADLTFDSGYPNGMEDGQPPHAISVSYICHCSGHCGRMRGRCGGAGFCVKHGVGAAKQRTGGALVRRIALITASRCLQTRRDSHGAARRRPAHPWRRLDQLRQKHHAEHGQLPCTSRPCRLLRRLSPLCGRQELMAGSARRRAACRALDTHQHTKVPITSEPSATPPVGNSPRCSGWKIHAITLTTRSRITPAVSRRSSTSATLPTSPSGGAEDGSSCINSGTLTNGQSYSVTFPELGNYQLVCLYHQNHTA